MGNRLHVCKKYEVEYSKTAGFNWGAFEVEKMLREANSKMCIYDKRDDDGSGDWAMDANEFKAAVETIRSWTDEKVRSFWNDSDESYSKDEVLALFDTFIAEGDSGDGYYHFAWF